MTSPQQRQSGHVPVETALRTVRVSDTRLDIILAHPRDHNALSPKLVDELSHTFTIADQLGVRLVVVRSTHPTFCSGFDKTDIGSRSDETILWRFARISLLLEQIQVSPCLVVAAIEGPAVGAGADLAMSCDLRIGTSDVRFRFPGSRFGLLLGAPRLVALLGEAKATRLRLCGESVTGEELSQLGALQLAKDPEHIDGELTRIEAEVCSRPPRVVYESKRASSQEAHDKALAQLVRSIAQEPGIADRMRNYFNGEGP